MTERPRFVAAAAFLALGATSMVARAQAPVRNPAAAQALFEEGRKLMTAGKLAEACPKLAESQRLDPGAGTLINLAACYEKNGQTASAWATYKEAIPESEKSQRAEWATRARQRAAALEAQLARLTITVPAEARAAGLLVKRDGIDVGSGELGVAIPVDPGSHTIEASAPGRKPWTQTTTATAKNTVTVTVPTLEQGERPTAVATPAPATSPPPSGATGAPASNPTPPPGPGPSSSSSQRTIGLVVGGVGVVGIAVGAVFGLTAIGSRSDARGDCTPDLKRCNQQGIDAVDDAKSKATISTIAFAAGGVLLAGGVVLVLTAPRKSDSVSLSPSAPLARSSVALKVSPTNGGFAFGLGGNFH